MKSVTSILFPAMPLVAAISIVLSSVRLATVPTGNAYDLTVFGRGYFGTIDDSDGNLIYRRSIRLAVDANGILCAKVGGRLLPLDPPIHLPNGQTRFDISQAGTVSVEHPGSSWTQVGSLSLTHFASENTEADERALVPSDTIGPAASGPPGLAGNGTILQAHRQEFVAPLNITNGIAIALAFFTVCGYLWHSHPQRP